MGAGKSTLAREIARSRQAFLFSEDEWLESLYPQTIRSVSDYVTYSDRIKGPLEPLVIQLLSSHQRVVMDFPGNTVSQRAWLRGLSESAGVNHTCIYLDVPDEECIRRVLARGNPQTDTRSMFDAVTQYFEVPSDHEALTLIKR